MSELKISKEQADQAFSIIVQAINAAMLGRFPAGIEHVEKCMQIKGALQVIGTVCHGVFGTAAAPVPEKKEP